MGHRSPYILQQPNSGSNFKFAATSELGVGSYYDMYGNQTLKWIRKRVIYQKNEPDTVAHIVFTLLVRTRIGLTEPSHIDLLCLE